MLTRPLDPRVVEAMTAGDAPEATIGSIWLAASARPIDDHLVRWPPDIFAFTDLILDHAEAYRFVVSPPSGRRWPPASAWPQDVSAAARRWSEWTPEQAGDLPDLVTREWGVVRNALDTPLDAVASGRGWRLTQALLTLHAVADEACAGVAPGTTAPDVGMGLRAQSRELLARAGTISRIDPGRLRVVPKYRTANGGITYRSISRYLSRLGPAVKYGVHMVSTAGGDAASQYLNMLLLPWPLRVSPGDFRALPQSVREREVEPFGFFRYEPSEPFDLALVQRLLTSAAEHVDQVDAVVLPESSMASEDLRGLETVLSRNGVGLVIAGVRGGSAGSDSFGSNSVYFGASRDGEWWHHRQHKHHRWSLDRSQIEQYHLEEVLDPRVRWWEAIKLERRSLEMIERNDGHTIAALVCEDLAQIDEVADLLRSVGPTLVVALVLDGPQLASRWTARYASVLADDPGSAVLTLTSSGMAARSWRDGQSPSNVVALWKDNSRGLREIKLDPDAQGILLSLQRDTAIRRAADGRAPQHNSSDLRVSAITQVQVVQTGRTAAGRPDRGLAADKPRTNPTKNGRPRSAWRTSMNTRA
jgi:hypothetical protein